MAEPANSDNNNVRVCVRVRPLNAGERSKTSDSVCVYPMNDGRTIRFTMPAEGHRKIETQFIKFDQSFAPETQQLEVFHRCGVEQYCDLAMDGYASTVFCYGQTGSGKTYTLSGPTMEDGLPSNNMSSADLGMQYRAAYYIMDAVRAAQAATPGLVGLRTSYYEIYNEHVNDLLNDTQNLKVRWNKKQQQFFIESLMMVECEGADDIMAVLEEGVRNRKKASHLLNQDSSRSHAVFTLYVERRASPGAPLTIGKVNFVDLAGSEKLKESGSEGINATETKNINRSLFTLGNVISALADRSATAFVPYRDSVLTRLLMDSLGGGCRTLMVATITPSAAYADETVSTLKYASRAKNIINATPSVRLDPEQQQLFELRTEVEALKRENQALKQQLMGQGLSPAPSARSGSAMPTDSTGGTPVPQQAPPAPPPQQQQQPRGQFNAKSPMQQQQQQQQQQHQQQQQFQQGGYPPQQHQPYPGQQPFAIDPSYQTPPQESFQHPHQQPQPGLYVGGSPSSFHQHHPMQSPSAGARSPYSDMGSARHPSGSGNMPLQRAPSVQSIASSAAHSHANAEISDRIRSDNERLRDEVAQLRSQLLVAKTPPQPDNNASDRPPMSSASSLPPPSAASSYGFRPAPGRGPPQAFRPPARLDSLGATNATTSSEPTRSSSGLYGGGGGGPTGGSPSPQGRAGGGQVGGGAGTPTAAQRLEMDQEMKRMRAQLDAAHRELLQMRNHS